MKNRLLAPFLVIVLTFLLPAPALALSFPRLGGGSPSATQQRGMQNRITNGKQRADSEIERRLTILNNLLTRINNSKNLSSSSKSTLAADVQNEINNLTALKSKIDADTDITNLKTDIQSIVNDYRVYLLMAPQVGLVVYADNEITAANNFSNAVPIIQNLISTAQSKGVDVTSMNASLQDLQSKVADAKTQAQNAESSVLSLTPSGYPGNKPTLQSALAMLKTGRSDLQAARQDWINIRQALQSAKVIGNSSSSATAK